MKVKICGLKAAADAELALRLGATHLGCVVAPDSPRSTTLPERIAIRELARERATFVLVVRGVGPEAVAALAADCEPDLVQCHGFDESAETALAERLPVPLMRVRRLAHDATELPPVPAGVSATIPAVFDGGAGGAGTRFPWHLLGSAAPANVFIAGGITAANVRDVLPHAPWGIDVSSGVEAAPGRKDPRKLRALFDGLQVNQS